MMSVHAMILNLKIMNVFCPEHTSQILFCMHLSPKPSDLNPSRISFYHCSILVTNREVGLTCGLSSIYKYIEY